MKRVISIAILFLLVGVGYAHADVIFKGPLSFAVSTIEEREYTTPDNGTGAKLVTSSERIIGNIYFVMDDALEQVLYIDFGMRDDFGVEHIIIHIDGANIAAISDDIYRATNCKVKIIGSGVFTDPESGLPGVAYVTLNITVYYPDGSNVTKMAITYGSKIGGGLSAPDVEPFIFSGTLNSSTLWPTAPN